MKNTNLKKSLKKKQLMLGSWITIPSINIVELLAQFDFDWLCIDTEHNMFNNETIISLIRSIQSYNIAALVRVSSNDEVVIKQCMDAGADGVIIPMINNKADAIDAVNSVYYPPIGKRGVGLSRAQDYGLSFEKYNNWLNENAVIIAQIEHYEAIDNLDEIISVNSIDGLLIGPYDLSASLGFPGQFEKDEVQDYLNKFKEKCYDSNISNGLHIVDPEKNILDNKIKDGFNLIAYGTDFNFLLRGVKSNFNK